MFNHNKSWCCLSPLTLELLGKMIMDKCYSVFTVVCDKIWSMRGGDVAMLNLKLYRQINKEILKNKTFGKVRSVHNPLRVYAKELEFQQWSVAQVSNLNWEPYYKHFRIFKFFIAMKLPKLSRKCLLWLHGPHPNFEEIASSSRLIFFLKQSICKLLVKHQNIFDLVLRNFQKNAALKESLHVTSKKQSHVDIKTFLSAHFLNGVSKMTNRNKWHSQECSQILLNITFSTEMAPLIFPTCLVVAAFCSVYLNNRSLSVICNRKLTNLLKNYLSNFFPLDFITSTQ